MRRHPLLLCATLLSACGGTPPSPPGPRAEATVEDAAVAPPSADAAVIADAASPVVAPPDAPVVPDLAPRDLGCNPCGPRVEEWGTYTSVQASDGHTLGGVHHEDETLPFWVHRREWEPGAYYVETLPEEPLQQLETPVLYFWSPVARSVQVTIDFPRGVVGQWYPDAESFAPKLNQMTELAKGTMTWNLTLDPTLSAADLPPVRPDEIWAPSRRVASTPVRFTPPGRAEEREQFIFYRGLGTFDPPIRVMAGDDGSLAIGNPSRETPGAAFVLRVAGDRGSIVRLGPLEAGATRMAAAPAASQDLDTYLGTARSLLQEALVASGLHDDVARAMVDTWSRSWFRNTGLRLLYLAPRAWTDAWLPTTITPTPSAFVRTLVGRIEILTPADERALVAQVRSRRRDDPSMDLEALGRFAEPRLARTLELLTAPADLAYAQVQLQAAHLRR